MSTFQPLQRKNQFTPLPAAATYPSLRPSRTLASRPAPASEQAHPATQAQLDHAARFGHSFGQVSLFPPEKKNNTGMPDSLKAGIETLSGMTMDDVQVHYHSSKPAQFAALAYTQGTDIHVGPGQEKHLAHEAWHVIQQKQGRVRPTIQLRGMKLNNEPQMEREAEVMGTKALLMSAPRDKLREVPVSSKATCSRTSPVIQSYSVNYGALVNDCGSEMHGWIYGKNDPDLKKGGKPTVVPNWWPSKANNASQPVIDYFANFIVQGHLLNQDLGGPGNKMDNLTPISRSTNTTHFKKIEDAVKTEVLQNDQLVEYRVRADYTKHPNLQDLGNNAPAGVGPYLQNMAGTIGADYTVYDAKGKAIGGPKGELLIKNEGPQLKGAFL